MKKFNLFKEIIIVDEQEFLNAINSQKEFGITLEGKITFTPKKEIVIFQGKHTPKLNAITPPKPLTIEEFLGKNYKSLTQEGKVGIKATLAWQDIVKLNYEKALYDDTSTDGVAEFADKDLEDIGWHATEFDIEYRELIEQLEQKCSGVLLCIEQESPSYQFSGLGFVDDTKEAYKILFTYCQNKIKEKLQNDPLYETLTEDEKEACEYFQIPL